MNNSSAAHRSATSQTITEQEKKVEIDFTSDNTEVYNKPFSIEGSETVNHEDQTPCTWTWWDPQQFVETSPWGHTENPKRDTKKDMDLCGFSWPVESSNSDPDPQTKQGPRWPTQL